MCHGMQSYLIPIGTAHQSIPETEVVQLRFEISSDYDRDGFEPIPKHPSTFGSNYEPASYQGPI